MTLFLRFRPTLSEHARETVHIRADFAEVGEADHRCVTPIRLLEALGTFDQALAFKRSADALDFEVAERDRGNQHNTPGMAVSPLGKQA